MSEAVNVFRGLVLGVMLGSLLWLAGAGVVWTATRPVPPHSPSTVCLFDVAALRCHQ